MAAKSAFRKDLTPTPLQGRGNWNWEFYNLNTINLVPDIACRECIKSAHQQII